MAFMAALAPMMSTIGTALSVVGTVVGGISSYQSSKYQAAVAQMNEQIAQDNARRAEQEGEQASQRQDMQNKAVMGQIESAQAASGLALNSGSSRMVRRSAAQLGRMDTQTMRHNYRLKAYGHKVDATNFNTQAVMANNQARAGLLSTFINAGTSLMGGAASHHEKWGSFKAPGTNYSSIGGLY